MSDIPKYVATPHDDDEFWCIGEGDTPEDALSALLGDAAWLSYADGMDEDASIPVYVYTCVKPEDSDWPEESIEPRWEWVAHERVKVVHATPAGILIPPYSLAPWKNTTLLLQTAMNDALDGEDIEKSVNELFEEYMSGDYDSYTLAIAAYRMGKGDSIGPMLSALVHTQKADRG